MQRSQCRAAFRLEAVLLIFPGAAEVEELADHDEERDTPHTEKQATCAREMSRIGESPSPIWSAIAESHGPEMLGIPRRKRGGSAWRMAHSTHSHAVALTKGSPRGNNALPHGRAGAACARPIQRSVFGLILEYFVLSEWKEEQKVESKYLWRRSTCGRTGPMDGRGMAALLV